MQERLSLKGGGLREETTPKPGHMLRELSRVGKAHPRLLQRFDGQLWLRRDHLNARSPRYVRHACKFVSTRIRPQGRSATTSFR